MRTGLLVLLEKVLLGVLRWSLLPPLLVLLERYSGAVAHTAKALLALLHPFRGSSAVALGAGRGSVAGQRVVRAAVPVALSGADRGSVESNRDGLEGRPAPARSAAAAREVPDAACAWSCSCMSGPGVGSPRRTVAPPRSVAASAPARRHASRATSPGATRAALKWCASYLARYFGHQLATTSRIAHSAAPRSGNRLATGTFAG